jgi:hypothetical protein
MPSLDARNSSPTCVLSIARSGRVAATLMVRVVSSESPWLSVTRSLAV